MTMSRAQKRRFQNDDEKKEKYNSTISSSIADIIRFSLDDEFRSKCFQLMQVNNTNDFQQAIKEKLDSLTNPSSMTTHTLQKRPSFHDEEVEKSLSHPSDRSGMFTQVNIEQQTDEVDKTEGLQNTEIPNPTLNITDSDIDEITKVFTMTNIVMEENIEERYRLPGTSGMLSNSFIKSEEIKKGISHLDVNYNEDELTEKTEDFWLSEECCQWDSSKIRENGEDILIQEEEINDIDLDENDTNW